MEHAEEEHDGPITAIQFEYFEILDQSLPSNDPKNMANG